MLGLQGAVQWKGIVSDCVEMEPGARHSSLKVALTKKSGFFVVYLGAANVCNFEPNTLYTLFQFR